MIRLDPRLCKHESILISTNAFLPSSGTNQWTTKPSYVAAIGVGTPPTTYQLIVDTGSSNTWVGASQAYVTTSSSMATNQPVSVAYGSASFSGNEFLDTVTILPELVIQGQSIGVATTLTGVSGVDGILGMGPVDLTAGTLNNQPSTNIPTVADILFSAGTVSANEFGISFEPAIQPQIMNGEITWDQAVRIAPSSLGRSITRKLSLLV